MAEEQQGFMPGFGTDFSRLEQERQRERASDEDRLGASELWDAAKESEWVYGRAKDAIRFNSTGGEPVVSQERLSNDLGATGTEQEYDFAARATTMEDYQARLDKIGDDRRLSRKIAGEGLRGIGYSMLAGAVDPALLPLYLGTGGAGAVGRLSVLAKTLRSGALGAAEGAAVESVLASGDTQRDWSDVALAGATSGILTGGITLGASGIRRLRKGGKGNPDPSRLDDDPGLTETAQAGDADIRAMAEDYRADRAVTAMENGMEIESLQSIDVRQNLVDELMPVAAQRLSRGERNPLVKQRDNLQRQINDLQAEQGRTKGPTAGGTARQRRAAAEARRARIAELEARIEPVRRQLDEVQGRLDEDLPRRQAWEDISRLTQGQVPKRYRERYEQMRRDGRTPMDREEARMSREAVERARAVRDEEARAQAEEAVRRPQGEAQEADTASVGAARVEGARDPQEAYAESGSLDVEEQVFRNVQADQNRPPRDRLRRLAGSGGRRASSTYTYLTGSESSGIRGMAHRLLSDPQAQARGNIPASQRVTNNHDRLVNAEGGREAVARDEWAREQGVNRIKMHLHAGKAAKDFDNAVVLEMRGIDQGSPAIKKAAEARRDNLSLALKMQKEAGVRGFENVEDNASYWSFMPDFHKMQRAVAKHDVEPVIETLTGSYMNGRFKLSENSARMVAQATYRRTMQKGLSEDQLSKYQLSQADMGSLRADMEASGVPTGMIDDFLEEIERTSLEENVSNRAKLSLGASQTYVGPNGLRMVDIIDTSINVTTKYNQEAAANAALARTGFKSRAEAEAALDETERQAKNALPRGDVDGESYETRSGNITEEAKTIRDSIKLLYGESLDVDPGAGLKASRNARKLTNIVALQWNGFASAGEASNQIVNMGLMTNLRNTRFRDFLSFGKIRGSEDLQSVGDLVGAYGQLGASIKDNNYTLHTIDEYNMGRLERIFNNAMGWLSNKSQIFSGFRSVQNGLENIALRSMQDRFVRIAEGKIEPTQRDFDEMERAGLTREQIDEVLTSIRENPEYVTTSDGREVRVFSGKHLNPSLKEDLGAAMTMMLSRNMQRGFVGETPLWMSKETGKLLTQFRSFGIVSTEKQTAAGLRGDTIGMFLKTLWGTGIGAAAYSSRAYLRAEESDDPEEEWEKYTGDPYRFSIGVANMAPQLGLLGMGMELTYASGLIPTDDDDSYLGRAGARPTSVENIVPAIGVGTDAANATFGSISHLINGDTDEAMESMKDAYGMLPIVNSAGVGAAMAIANQED